MTQSLEFFTNDFTAFFTKSYAICQNIFPAIIPQGFVISAVSDLLHAFAEMGLPCFEPYGAFYVFPCIKEFGMTSDEFATRFLQEEKVAVVPGTAFGDSGEGYIRISYAYSLENLKVAIGRLSHFVKKLKAEKE